MREKVSRTPRRFTTKQTPADTWTQFAEAIERSRMPLIRVAYRTTKNMEEAEDVVQESIIKAYLCLHQFRGDARIETWLRAIVINTARNWIRRRRGYVQLSIEEGHADHPEFRLRELADDRRNPEQWFEYNEMEARVMAAIGELSSRYQPVIRMCVLGECSYLEASSALNLNLVTVKARVFRGREMLKRSLEYAPRERLRSVTAPVNP